MPKIRRMYVILYDDGSTCLTRWKPDEQSNLFLGIVAIKEVQIAEGDGLQQHYKGPY